MLSVDCLSGPMTVASSEPAVNPTWVMAAPMWFAHRQRSATILADETVLESVAFGMGQTSVSDLSTH
jgi:hypothetical protein